MAKKGSYNPGPLTDEGKAVSSLNATLHGGCSERHTILPDERKEDFDALIVKWNDEFHIENQSDLGFLHTLAKREWQLLRCERNLDRVQIELMERKPNPLDWTKEEHHAIHLMQRYLTTAERSFHAVLKTFETLRKHRMEQVKLEQTTKLKVVEVQRKIELGLKIQEIRKTKLDLEKIKALKDNNLTEWDLMVFRTQQQQQQEQQPKGDETDG